MTFCWADRFAIGIAIFAAFWGWTWSEPFSAPLYETLKFMSGFALVFGGLTWVFLRTLNFMFGGRL